MKDNNNISIVPTDKPYIFCLKLIDSKSKPRLLGFLDKSKEGTFLTARYENQIFQKDRSIGINYQLLISNDVKFEWIIIDYDGRKLVTSRHYFLANGKPRQFGGFDLQLFLPIEKFGLSKAREFESLNYIKMHNQLELNLFK